MRHNTAARDDFREYGTVVFYIAETIYCVR